MRILLFEERADQEHGHYPHWIAQLTAELSADGHDVHVLTRHGWVGGRSIDGASATYRMTRRHRAIGSLGTEIRRQSWLRLGKRRGRPLAFFGDALRQIALVAALRHRAGLLGHAADTAVIVTSAISPVEAAIFGPARAQWVLYSHEVPARVGGALNVPRIVRFAGRCEGRRRQRGGFVRFVTNNDPVGSAWRERVPWITYEVIGSAGRQQVEPMSRSAARVALGLAADGPIALCFGAPHGGKDVETLLVAFAGNAPPAHLVLAGRDTGARVAAFRSAHPELSLPEVTVLDGYMTDRQVHLLHSAADYAVLSFFPHWTNDSGTMGDAIGRGIPVCCSDTADNGRLVREYGLGELFVAGDAGSLRAAAARMTGMTLDRAGQAGYLAEFSPQALTRQLLSVASPRGSPGPP